MGYKSKIKALQGYVKELRMVKEMLEAIQLHVTDIEEQVNDIDLSLPQNEAINEIRNPKDREELSHALDLLDEVDLLLDEILGPEDDEDTGQPVGTAFDPVAKGNNHPANAIDAMLQGYSPKKHNVS